jgi:hypothetical protein
MPHFPVIVQEQVELAIVSLSAARVFVPCCLAACLTFYVSCLPFPSSHGIPRQSIPRQGTWSERLAFSFLHFVINRSFNPCCLPRAGVSSRHPYRWFFNPPARRQRRGGGDRWGVGAPNTRGEGGE